jgi:hypothetical protein
MEEVVIGFEGQKRDLNDFVFDLFEAHMLRAGLEKETPGDGKIVVKPMLLRKGFTLGLMEIGLTFGTAAGAQLFANWLSDKWKKNGEKRINVKIENHLYQFDPALIAKAIEGAMAKLEEKKRPIGALRTPSEDRSASGDRQRRKKPRS